MTANETDWAQELREDYLHSPVRPIRWELWASQTITSLRNQNSGQPGDAEHGDLAAKMLREIAGYLDKHYDQGFDGISLMPMSCFNLSFDR